MSIKDFEKQYAKAIVNEKEAKYSSYSHHSVDTGYQNPVIAKKFAAYVVKVLETRFPVLKHRTKKKRAIVNLFAIDGSSTYLTAFVKMLRPNWRLVTIGRKERDDFAPMVKIDPDSTEINVFVDDYFSWGRATADVIKAIEAKVEELVFEDGDDSFMQGSLICIYIAMSDTKRSYILKGIKEAYKGDVLPYQLEFYSQSEGMEEIT